MPKEKGFTLVELLIVITIIAILAGIVLSTLNVNLLLKRARDSVVVSTITKMAFTLESFVSATGRVPSNDGCDCDPQNMCEFMYEVQDTVECYKTQRVSEGTKLWMTVQSLKYGKTLLPNVFDLDDSDAIRYHDWNGGCIAAVSEANPPWVFVYHRNVGLMVCHPGEALHPGLFTCEHMLDDKFRKLNCDHY